VNGGGERIMTRISLCGEGRRLENWPLTEFSKLSEEGYPHDDIKLQLSNLT
jgi:hypothetical protein